jgi:hypothetical protein
MATSKQKPAESAVAVINKTAMALAIDFSADAGGGMEGADADSYAIPFLSVLQKGSPQCDEADGKFIEGAKPGMFYNSVSNACVDGKTGVTFLPCAYQRRFIRWAAKGGDGANFKGEMLPEDVAAMQANGQLKELEGRWYFPLEDGTVSEKKCDRVADVRNHYGIVVNEDGSYVQVLLSLSSTQIKKSKAMMSLLAGVKVQGRTPPTWLNKVKLTTVPESNDKGSWMGLKVELDGFCEDGEIYAAGKAFNQSVGGGNVKANYEHAAEAAQPDPDKF